MSKSTTALIFLLATVLFVFSVKAQERDDSRLTPAERNRTGTVATAHTRSIMSSRPPALIAA